MKILTKQTIYGCDERGDGDSPYLTRFTIVSLADKGVKLCLHKFHRSDYDDLHDHPWNFWSLILWNGYVEETEFKFPTLGIHDRKQKRVWPGMLLRRPADHKHRVVLLRDKRGREKKAITLVWMGPKVREWGFWTRNGWEHWVSYIKKLGCAKV